LLESYGWKEDSRRQCDVLVPLETPCGETTRTRFWRFRSDAMKMGSSARRYVPRCSIVFPPQNYNSQSIGSAVGPHHSPLSAPLHENTTQMWARPCGPRLWSIANAPGANFSPFRCPPHGLGHAALDSDHAESATSIISQKLNIFIEYFQYCRQ